MKLSILPKYCAIFLIICFSGCCGCDDVGTYCVNVNNTTLTAIDNRDSVAYPAGNEPLLPEAFFLQLHIDNESKICYTKPSSSFFNTAYALTCPHDKYQLQDSISKAELTCNLDYAVGYPAGAMLNDLFTLPPKYHNYPLPEHYDFNTTDESPVFKLYPRQSPMDTGTHIFYIKLYMADGTVIEANTTPVKFKL